jgi:hypothetical protein
VLSRLPKEKSVELDIFVIDVWCVVLHLSQTEWCATCNFRKFVQLKIGQLTINTCKSIKTGEQIDKVHRTTA